MADRAHVLSQFLKDTAQHRLEVVREDGLYRHLRCRKPGTYCYGFDILTWPGHLAITGDMGASVFSRLDDMLHFFRTTDDRHDRAGGLSINPGYWAEKLVANDGNRLEFEAALFRDYVKERFDAYVAEHADDDDVPPAWAPDLWAELEESVLFDGEGEDAVTIAIQRMTDFEPDGEPYTSFRFHDAWESSSSLQRHTFHFTWRLYAIAWAVRAYDALCAARAAEVAHG